VFRRCNIDLRRLWTVERTLVGGNNDVVDIVIKLTHHMTSNTQTSVTSRILSPVSKFFRQQRGVGSAAVAAFHKTSFSRELIHCTGMDRVTADKDHKTMLFQSRQPLSSFSKTKTQKTWKRTRVNVH